MPNIIYTYIYRIYTYIKYVQRASEDHDAGLLVVQVEVHAYSYNDLSIPDLYRFINCKNPSHLSINISTAPIKAMPKL